MLWIFYLTHEICSCDTWDGIREMVNRKMVTEEREELIWQMSKVNWLKEQKIQESRM